MSFEIQLFIIFLVLNNIINNLQVISCQRIPTTPCPEYFRYKYIDGEYYGFIEVPAPMIGQSLRVSTTFSVNARTEGYPGTIQLAHSNEMILQLISQNRPIRYRITFPLQSPLPKLTRIGYNAQTICRGTPATGNVVTSLDLHYTLNSYLETKQSGGNEYHAGSTSPQNQAIPSLGSKFDRDSSFLTNEFMTQPPAQIPVQPSDTPIRTQINQELFPKTSAKEQTFSVNQQPRSQTPDATAERSQNECGRIHPKYSAQPLAFGAEEVARGTWPWLVALYQQIDGSIKFQCGSNLISTTAVITAAHCLFVSQKRMSASEVLLYLGRYDVTKWNDPGVIAANADRIYVHHDFRPDSGSFDADIAIVTIQPVVYTEYIRPVCLWTLPEDDITDQDGWIVGWGRSEAHQKLSPRPRKLKTKIVDEGTCLRSSDFFSSLTSNRTLCAGNLDGSGPCTGDSGAGLMLLRNGRWTLRGTVSFALADHTTNSCDLSHYQVYSDVSKFIRWIYSVIQT